MDPLRPLGPSPGLAIDRVEVREAGTDGTLLVRCLGRGTATGRPTLVLTRGGKDFRFPALPAPPSLAAGTLRAAFSVPGELREALWDEPRVEVDGRSLPLPPPTQPAIAVAPPAEPAGAPALLADRRAERAERAAAEQAGRADEAESLAADLAVRLARTESRLAEAEAEAEAPDAATRLAELSGELERSRQVAFAEGRRREEIEVEAAERIRLLEAERDDLRARLRGAEQARDELRGRLRELQRLRDAVQDPGFAAGGELARALAETAPDTPARPTGPADPVVLRREGELAGLFRPGARPPSAAEEIPPPAAAAIVPEPLSPPAEEVVPPAPPAAGEEEPGAGTPTPGVWPATAWPEGARPADPERLDAALARLRAGAPADELAELEPVTPAPEARPPRGPFARWRARRRRRKELAATRAHRPDAGA